MEDPSELNIEVLRSKRVAYELFSWSSGLKTLLRRYGVAEFGDFGLPSTVLRTFLPKL